MEISYVPVLEALRELYSRPRDFGRFREYLRALTGDGDDIALPITQANPMAREHALGKVEELLALGAEEIGAAVTAEAARRLASIDGTVKASIVLADDVGGGWTNRYTTEAMVRFPTRGVSKRPFACALTWTSEPVSPEALRNEVLAAIYRVAYQLRCELPRDLKAMLRQEGLASVFAGGPPVLDAPELARVRQVIEALGHAPTYPSAFAAMYGDAAARELGYPPVGLPARAGFELALAEALQQRLDPVAVLA